MKRRLMYDLQFFADDTSGTGDSGSDSSASEGTDAGSDGDGGGIDPEAFAAILAEKDKKLEEVSEEVKQLKKSNAELLLKISASKKTEKPIEETIIDFCDTRKPVKRQ